MAVRSWERWLRDISFGARARRTTRRAEPSRIELARNGNDELSAHLLRGRAGYKSRPHEKHLAQISSSDTPVVVMEPTEHGDCVDAAIRLEWTWNRLLVPEGLVRTRFVVVADVLGDDAPEVILTEDEDVVEQLSPECADEALSKGIHVRRAYRRAHDAHARRPEYKQRSESPVSCRGRGRQPVVRGPWWRSWPAARTRAGYFLHPHVPGCVTPPF